MKVLPVGKVPGRLLARLFRRLPKDPSVLLGPALGEDAAALRVRAGCVVAAADPISFVADDIGEYAVVINANDVATRGARPRWFLATGLLPEKRTTPVLVARLFSQLERAARRAGVALVGGHTEVTAGLERPIVAGCMLGEIEPGRLVRSSGARPGDLVLLSKGIAIEAASVLARAFAKELRRRFPEGFLRRCRALGRRLSVVDEALAAVAAGPVSAMHDPTEGGLSTGLYEVAEASRVRIEVDAAAIPVLPDSRRLLAHFGADPLGALASGALLICVPGRAAARVLRALARRDIPAAAIGRVRRGRGVVLKEAKHARAFPRFPVDELARLF